MRWRWHEDVGAAARPLGAARAAGHARARRPAGAPLDVFHRPIGVVDHGARQRCTGGGAGGGGGARQARVASGLRSVQSGEVSSEVDLRPQLVGVGVGLEDGARHCEVVEERQRRNLRRVPGRRPLLLLLLPLSGRLVRVGPLALQQVEPRELGEEGDLEVARLEHAQQPHVRGARRAAQRRARRAELRALRELDDPRRRPQEDSTEEVVVSEELVRLQDAHLESELACRAREVVLLPAEPTVLVLGGSGVVVVVVAVGGGPRRHRPRHPRPRRGSVGEGAA